MSGFQYQKCLWDLMEKPDTSLTAKETTVLNNKDNLNILIFKNTFQDIQTNVY